MKQVIAARTDLGMGRGKLAAQVAHAAMNAAENADPDAVRAWKDAGQPKIVVKVGSESELLEVAENARRRGLPTSIVRDAGRTQLDSGTATTCGVGPAQDNEVDAVTGDLSLY